MLKFVILLLNKNTVIIARYSLVNEAMSEEMLSVLSQPLHELEKRRGSRVPLDFSSTIEDREKILKYVIKIAYAITKKSPDPK